VFDLALGFEGARGVNNLVSLAAAHLSVEFVVSPGWAVGAHVGRAAGCVRGNDAALRNTDSCKRPRDTPSKFDQVKRQTIYKKKSSVRESKLFLK
jgi:hypothetical protein